MNQCVHVVECGATTVLPMVLAGLQCVLQGVGEDWGMVGGGGRC